MTLRRGFKTESNKISRELRQEMKLPPHSPVCPWTLSDILEIPLIRLSDLEEIPNATKLLSGKEKYSFSAVTVFHGYKRCIVYNDFHHPKFQSSSVIHEVSHSILGYPPAPPFNEYGCRNYKEWVEEEENWLSPAILISEEAELYITRSNMTLNQASEKYRVSEKLMKMRLNVTGESKRVNRWKAYKRTA